MEPDNSGEPKFASSWLGVTEIVNKGDVFNDNPAEDFGSIDLEKDIISWSGKIRALGTIASFKGRILGERGIAGGQVIYARGDIISWKGSISGGSVYSHEGEVYAETINAYLGGVEARKVTADKIVAAYVSCEYMRGRSLLLPTIELIDHGPLFEKSVYVGYHISRLFEMNEKTELT